MNQPHAAARRPPYVALCIALVVAAFVAWQLHKRPTKSGPGTSIKAFFSVDDGATYFVDDSHNLPPWQTAAGKTAYRAQVVRCGSGQPYVAYLERYAEEDKRRFARMNLPAAGNEGLLVTMGSASKVTVKKPSTAENGWVSRSDQTAQKYKAIVEPSCPDGSSPERVAPQ